MRLGGIWDHVGHGFHRYSTDARWLVPHFEKMLYDQALTALAALDACQLTGKAEYARTAEEIFTYVLRDMTSAEGGFYSAEDADSEGEEGRFYVWTQADLRRVLGEKEAAFWEPVFNVTAEGNYREEASGRPTGSNILHLDRPLSAWARELGVAESELEARWEGARARLFAARETRVHPLKDDKVLADWNGLMIAALAEGARVLGNAEYEAAAERAARFVLAQMRGADGRLFHRFRLGERAVRGQATDYAFMVHGLLHLYRATFRVEWAEEAAALQRVMVAELWDEAAGGFFLAAPDERELPVRPKDLADGAAPSANSVALTNLLWLSRLTGDTGWAERAQAMVRAFAGTIERQPAGFVYFLCGLDFALRPGQDVVLAGEAQSPDARRLIDVLNGGFAPNRVALFKSGENAARLARLAGYTDGIDIARGGAAAHLCVGASCKESVTSVDDLVARLAGKTHDRG